MVDKEFLYRIADTIGLRLVVGKDGIDLKATGTITLNLGELDVEMEPVTIAGLYDEACNEAVLLIALVEDLAILVHWPSGEEKKILFLNLGMLDYTDDDYNDFFDIHTPETIVEMCEGGIIDGYVRKTNQVDWKRSINAGIAG